MKKISLILAILIFPGSLIFAQDSSILNSSKNAKNTVYVYGGTILFESSRGFAYERKILSTENTILSSLWIKGRGSYFGTRSSGPYFVSSSYYDLSMVALSGQTKYHFELDLGLGMLLPSTDFLPSISAGFRRQKQSGGLIFRTGLGYPEFLYLSLGGAF